MLIYRFLAKKDNRIPFDDRKHIQIPAVLKILAGFEADLVCLENGKLVSYRITLDETKVTDKPITHTTKPDDIDQWFWDVNVKKWICLDMNNAKYFEPDFET